jgi:hypothetical protein
MVLLLLDVVDGACRLAVTVNRKDYFAEREPGLKVARIVPNDLGMTPSFHRRHF